MKQRAARPVNQRTNYIPIMIGEPGIGKSTTLRCIASDLGWKFKRWDVNTQGFEDITGLPTIVDKVVGKHTQKVATFAKAGFVPGAVWEADGTFTLGEIGELPTAPPNVQNILREMIDGQLNGEPLDPKCLFVATGNPPEARFTTGGQIDEAIEDRLDPYIVVPTSEELLEVWSKIMFQTVYQFLTINSTFVDALSPRHWMIIAEKVDNLVNAGESTAMIIGDVCTAFVNCPNVIPPLQEFILNGNNPELTPVLARHLVAADERALKGYLTRISKWISGNSLRGLLGATKTDLIRLLSQLTGTDTANLPKLGHNVVMFMEQLIDGKCHDMAKNILDVAYVSDSTVTAAVLDTLKTSKILTDMATKHKEFNDMACKMKEKLNKI